ncbi:MAG TPA: nitronate monooxygenase [Cyanobacteria bacterium UBA8530]|nr:nitronate monooxygenase [Cyanobacteria bacterium UBA8530]
MKLRPLVIGDLIAKIPIIQGGMGIGISRSRLAAAVANCGGIGVISGVQIGFDEPDHNNNARAANIRALRKHIRTAKELSPKGIIGLNLLVAGTEYDQLVAVAVEEKIDLIISGAGLPSTLPGLVKGSDTKIAPIVSSARAAQVITKMWEKKYQRLPDLIIVEGPEAGGHLGFTLEQLEENEIDLKDILTEVLAVLKPFEEKYRKKIPVVCAGGIFYGKDIAACLAAGADGVQMSTRFVATDECDADEKFKKAYVEARKEDIHLVNSPVGMPGRAIRNAFTEKMKNGSEKISKCYNCLKTCDPKDTPYCISQALICAVKGDLEEGLIFSGSNSYKVEGIVKVSDLMAELVQEAESLPSPEYSELPMEREEK